MYVILVVFVLYGSVVYCSILESRYDFNFLQILTTLITDMTDAFPVSAPDCKIIKNNISRIKNEPMSTMFTKVIKWNINKQIMLNSRRVIRFLRPSNY